MQLTPDQHKAQNSKSPIPKELEKLAQNSALNSQKVNPQQNSRNLKLVANQSQSKPAIVRRNSPSQKG